MNRHISDRLQESARECSDQFALRKAWSALSGVPGAGAEGRREAWRCGNVGVGSGQGVLLDSRSPLGNSLTSQRLSASQIIGTSRSAGNQ